MSVAILACEADNPFEDNIGKGEHIGDFKLLSPGNFSSLMLNQAQQEKVINIDWEDAPTGLNSSPSYTFLMDTKSGDFSSPILSIPSDSSGTMSSISITYGQLIASLDNVTETEFIWNVEAKTQTDLGGNAKMAEDAFEVNIQISEEGISDFQYVSPELNEKIGIDRFGKTNENIVFDWEDATSLSGNDITFKIQFDQHGGDFTAPLLDTISNAAGAESQFTITHSDLSKFLEDVTFEDGLDWRVVAMVGDQTYSPGAQYVRFSIVSPGPDNLYLVGGSTPAGWDPPSSIPFTNVSEGVWEIYEYLTDGDGFKLLEVKDWAGDWGMSPGNPGVLEQEGESNIPVPADGFYRIRVDFTTLSYSLEQLNLYLVGGSTVAGWDPSSSVPLVNNGDGTFEIYTYLQAADGFKLLEVQDWAGDWGMSPGNEGVLIQEGEENIPVTTDGFYRIFVDLKSNTYSVEPIEWAIIGSATPNDWDGPDTNMTHSGNLGDYSWTLDVTLVDGELKFRANDGWDINFGDNGNDGSLEYGGSNIPVTAGTYTVTLTLDPVNGYSYSIN